MKIVEVSTTVYALISKCVIDAGVRVTFNMILLTFPRASQKNMVRIYHKRLFLNPNSNLLV